MTAPTITAEQHAENEASRRRKAHAIALHAYHLGLDEPTFVAHVGSLPYSLPRGTEGLTMTRFARQAYAAAGVHEHPPHTRDSPTWRHARDLLTTWSTWPTGWPALGRLEPLDVTCHACPQPALVITPAFGQTTLARCLGHPPTADDWGHTLDWTPRPCNRPLRCYCFRHDLATPIVETSTVIDRQAIQSGKRRANPTDYQAARDHHPPADQAG